MNKNIKYVVYTALFGDYDVLRELSFKSNDCDYICFTDQDIKSNSWKIIRLTSDEKSSVLMNRKLKMLPHLYLKNYDMSMYVDTNIQITKDVQSLFIKYLEGKILALPSHFERNCIYDEITQCIFYHKISESDGLKWKSFLESENFPIQFGLGENNIILRRHNNSTIIELMNLWWGLFRDGVKRDQLSLMYLIWKQGVEFQFMNETSRNKNIYFKYYLHNLGYSGKRLKVLSLYIDARRERNIFYKVLFFVKHRIKNL